MAEAKVKVPKFKLQSRVWFPLRANEGMFRMEDGQSYYYPVAEENIKREIDLAHRYAKRYEIEVETQVIKVIYEDDGADVFSVVLMLTPKNNARALAYKAEVESGVLEKVPGGRTWYPVKMGEQIYRCPVGGVVYVAVPDTNSNYVMSIAKSYASRLGFAVATKLGKAIVVENGKEIVRRFVILTPSGNEKAIEYAAKIAAEGAIDPSEGGNQPEEFVIPDAAPAGDGPKRRGRPPVTR